MLEAVLFACQYHMWHTSYNWSTICLSLWYSTIIWHNFSFSMPRLRTTCGFLEYTTITSFILFLFFLTVALICLIHPSEFACVAKGKKSFRKFHLAFPIWIAFSSQVRKSNGVLSLCSIIPIVQWKNSCILSTILERLRKMCAKIPLITCLPYTFTLTIMMFWFCLCLNPFRPGTQKLLAPSMKAF